LSWGVLPVAMYCQANTCGTDGGMQRGLEYVGSGQGEFAVEPQMKYVGYGGDYSVRRVGGNACCIILGPALACLLLTLGLLCYMFWPAVVAEECLEHRELYQYHWSLQKTYRCCTRGFVECPAQTTQEPIASGPVDPFNCADGVLNWQAGWSTQKKQWCCEQHGQGCGQDAEVAAAEYDCNAAFANWVKGWSEGKKAWCCARGTKSCQSDAAAAGMGYGAGTQHGADFNGAPLAPIRDVPFDQAQR